MKHTAIISVTIAAFLCVLPFSVEAAEVFFDDFDDDLSNWVEMNQNVWEWDWTIDNSNLVVENFNTWVTNSDLDGEWALVTLFQNGDFDPPLGDFNVTFQFAWNSDDPRTGDPSLKAMQRLYVQIYDVDGVQIARAGYSDSWVAANGGQHAKIREGTEIEASPNELESSGSANINISRSGSEIKLGWNGSLLVSGINNKPLQTIGILFYYYPYDGMGGPSFFGTEFVDFVRVEDEPASDETTTSTSSISDTTTTIPCPTGLIDCGEGLCCPPWRPQCCGDTCCRADQMCFDGVCADSPPCFGSTVYGEDSEEVELLRKYRDEVLSTTAVGKEIIDLYYLWSPAIVRAMDEDKAFREELKETVDGILPMIREEVE